MNKPVTEGVARSRRKKLDLGIIGIFCAALGLTFDSKAKGAEVGQAAPKCTLTPLGSEQRDERRYDLQQFQGKVLYVDFWASWCSPCARSFSFMNALDRELSGQGLHIVGINLDEKLDDAKSFLIKHPASFAVAVDADGRCPKDFGVQAMPSSYLVDRHGIIRHAHLGFRRGEAETLRDLVVQLLAERPEGR